jgi:hypothetical protein
MTDPTAPPVLSPLLEKLAKAAGDGKTRQINMAMDIEPNLAVLAFREAATPAVVLELLAELDAQRAEVARLTSRTCVTCKHGTDRDEYGDLVCTHPKMVAAGYASSYFHVPSPDFGCTFHEAALTSPDAEKP